MLGERSGWMSRAEWPATRARSEARVAIGGTGGRRGVTRARRSAIDARQQACRHSTRGEARAALNDRERGAVRCRCGAGRSSGARVRCERGEARSTRGAGAISTRPQCNRNAAMGDLNFGRVRSRRGHVRSHRGHWRAQRGCRRSERGCGQSERGLARSDFGKAGSAPGAAESPRRCMQSTTRSARCVGRLLRAVRRAMHGAACPLSRHANAAGAARRRENVPAA